MTKERIDKLLVTGGFADSPACAQALVMAGVVLVSERRVEKSSQMFPPDADIRIKGVTTETKYVSRAGLKLEKAIDEFHIRPDGYICLDVGSSTGGFTDCLLKRDAARVTAVDVGTNQLVWSLRTDPRVDVRENFNARNMKPGDFAEPFDLAVMDVSFISATMILPAIVPLLKTDGRIVVLIKPQFEVKRSEVGKGGIVKDPEKHERVVREVNDFAETCGLRTAATIESPILGAEGNKEFLSLYERPG